MCGSAICRPRWSWSSSGPSSPSSGEIAIATVFPLEEGKQARQRDGEGQFAGGCDADGTNRNAKGKGRGKGKDSWVWDAWSWGGWGYDPYDSWSKGMMKRKSKGKL
ncbi:unnamed protein product [Prorocentrum cordatum]|uniref:Uncharacterized protein n=1 Tax=Prorocentrum cordatum TaxID=2364126 RepID=A0ABN9R5T5_9DINO|nr:unnamed protein product [Polarella glacialis]